VGILPQSPAQQTRQRSLPSTCLVGPGPRQSRFSVGRSGTPAPLPDSACRRERPGFAPVPVQRRLAAGLARDEDLQYRFSAAWLRDWPAMRSCCWSSRLCRRKPSARIKRRD
jgi:hypothetical protein